MATAKKPTSKKAKRTQAAPKKTAIAKTPKTPKTPKASKTVKATAASTAKVAKSRQQPAKRAAKVIPKDPDSKAPVIAAAQPQTKVDPLVSKPAKLTAGQRAYQVVASKLFGRAYLLFSLLVLAATTLLWSILGARLQAGNADQLADPYLFSDGATFHGADFPSAHSFLIKWPLFWLTRLTGVSVTSLTIITVGAVLLTVAILVAVLYRLERRPLVFGTICLALASCLLLVPAQPGAGVLLPVNMAMLTTRNLEYAVYLAAAVLLVEARRTRDWRFWSAAGLLGLLAASDKLFLAMGLGGAAAAVLVYGLRRHWQLVETSIRWFLGGLLALVLAYAILAALQGSGATNFIGGSDAPYQAIRGFKDLALGSIFAVLGFLTNLGANPGYSAVELSQLPQRLSDGLFSLTGLAYVLNFALVSFGLIAVWRITWPTVFGRRADWTKLEKSHLLSVMLIWTSLAAVGFFIVSNHYYPVDARYLTICLFAVFIAIATVLRSRRAPRPDALVVLGFMLVLGMALAIPHVTHTYNQGQTALQTTSSRNTLVAQALGQHRVDVLVGDYWRVLPIKQASKGAQRVMPLGDCTTPRNTLTSQAWQPDLTKHSFAYLLSYDRGLTDYPDCTLKQIVAAYGRPNASVLVAGNFSHPKEALLFFDHGSHQYVPPSTKAVTQPLASVIPISLDELPHTTCEGPTIMNVVAHQDDDLLFMNPDLLHDIQAGHCVRTVYVTAGDAGADQFYWLSRQQGSEDAYSTMLTTKDQWVQRIVKLDDNSYVTVANPSGNSKISLIFLNLPDGGVYGDGFRSSHNQSLAKLEAGRIPSEQTVDHQSSYTKDQLTNSLATLLHTYQPAEIRTQDPTNESSQYPDHSDHLAVGRIMQGAYDKYETDQYENKVIIPLNHYVGYPIHSFAPNVDGSDLEQKQTAFLAYAKHDGGVCHSANECANNPAYGAYLVRQYQKP